MEKIRELINDFVKMTAKNLTESVTEFIEENKHRIALLADKDDFVNLLETLGYDCDVLPEEQIEEMFNIYWDKFCTNDTVSEIESSIALEIAQEFKLQ